MKKLIFAAAVALMLTACAESNNSERKTIGDNPVSKVNSQENINSNATESNSQIIDETDSSDSVVLTKDNIIDYIVEGYNSKATNKLMFNEDFVVSDKDSSHYRTEFRLNAYRDAVGKSYLVNNQIVDFISTQSMFDDIDVRIYTDEASMDQCIELISFASSLLDTTISDKIVEEAINYVSENKNANGYYYGELGLVMQKTGEDSYDFMIKTD